MPFLGTRGAGTNKAFGFAGAAKPNQVTGLTATDFGTSRAYNNGRIDLSWTAPGNNGATISGYLIERSTDNSTYSTLVANTGTSATTYSDTSLTSSQIYYYKVSAINAAGTGDASTASSATATTVPQAPTIGTATDGGTGTTVTVTYTAGATGGKAVSVYTATSSPGSLTGTGASPITVSGLTTGTAYTFTVTATNANGTSAASTASNSVTPITPSSFESIATFTPTSGQTVTFSSIPSTYKSLQLRINLIASDNNSTFLRFNGDTGTNYARHYFVGGYSASANQIYTTGEQDLAFIPLTGNAYASGNPTYPYVCIVDIVDYASTSKNKTVRAVLGTNRNNTGNAELQILSGLYRTNTAINSITFFFNGSSVFNSGTSIALYGVK